LRKRIGAWERIWLFGGRIRLFKRATYKNKALLNNRKEQGCFVEKNRGLGKNMALLRKNQSLQKSTYESTRELTNRAIHKTSAGETTYMDRSLL